MKFAQIIMLLCQFVHRWCLFFVIYMFQNILSVCCNPLHVLGMPLGNLFGQELQSHNWAYRMAFNYVTSLNSSCLYEVTRLTSYNQKLIQWIFSDVQCVTHKYNMHCFTQITRFNRFIRLFSAGATSSLVCCRLHWKWDKPARHCLSCWLSLLRR